MGAQFIGLNDGLDVVVCIFSTEFRDNIPRDYFSGWTECFRELCDLPWAAYADKNFRQVKFSALETLVDLLDGSKAFSAPSTKLSFIVSSKHSAKEKFVPKSSWMMELAMLFLHAGQ